ncbi:hypothetical protein [Streptomyces sp. NPDC003077]|uniref:hypothetical protein n=1 Tax=Streptomyces sp. NPDC003077 TaxID=3154443 RepID=UPI0033A2BA5D
MQRHRVTVPLALGAGAWAAMTLWTRLDDYRVPGSLLFTCTALAATAAISAVLSLAEALGTTTHRCSEPGCRFEVRLRRTDTAEARRWQETAAAHPDHRYRP